MIRGTPPLLPWQPCLLAAIAGILALEYPLAAGTGLVLLALFPRPAPGRPSLTAMVLSFLAGLAVAWWVMPPLPGPLPPCLARGKPLDCVGRVETVAPRPEGRLSCLLADVRLTGPDCDAVALPGRLALTIDTPAFRPLPGDRLAFTSKIRPTRGFANPGVTDFAFLRRLDGVFFRAYARGAETGNLRRLEATPNVADRWRERIRDRVLSVLTPPAEADSATRAGRAMVAALLFGELSGFAATDLDLIRQASLAHTLALSGMNVSYVVAVAIALVWIAGRWHPAIFLRTPRPYLILLVAAPLVAGYCWLGGYSPSLYRAVLMFAGCGLLLFLGRHAPLCDSLFLALAAMLAVSPLTAYDVRLQLSAAAVAGIGLLWPPFGAFCSRLPRSRLFRWIVVPVLAVLWTSLCAEAAVLPIIVRLFGDWNCNPWINAAWLPLLGFVVTPMALIGLALLPVPLLSAAGAWLLLAAAWCCQELMHGLAWLESHGLLLSTAVLRPAWPELLGCYGLLASLALVLAGRPKPLAALLTSLALLVGPGLWRDLADSREAVSLTVFDVGQGQSVAVTLPGGKRLLVDGGGLFGNFDVGRAVVGAALADNHPPRLEAVFASHPHSDHVKGLISLLQRFSVASYDDNGGLPEGALAAPIQAALAERRIPRTSLAAGDRLNLGHDLALDVLHPGPDDDPSGNNGSLVLRLTWHGRGLAVLPGDIERSVAHRLTRTGTPLQAAVLVLPHHGSSSSLSRLFHAAVAPRVAIASAGDSGRYPSGKVVESLARLGCPTYATNRHGAVTVRFDSPTAAPVVETMGGTDASGGQRAQPFGNPP
ncbi:MAG: ComEC/Rec2 family competence protein [Desulfovibrionaceae bacterium]